MDRYDLKVLMNHALSSKRRHDGYVPVSVDHLRDAAEKVSAFLRRRLARSRYAGYDRPSQAPVAK